MSPEHGNSRLATQDSQLIFGIVADKVMHRSLKPNDVSSILTGPTFRKLEVGSSKFEAYQTRVFILHTSHFKLPWFFDNLVVMQFCAHDVAVACCLAMAEVWVRLPLGALQNPVWPNGKAAPC